MLEKNRVQGFGIKAEHLNCSVGPVPPARSLWLTGTNISAPVQSCGGTTLEAALQEVTQGLQKGNGLKKKKKKSTSRCLLTCSKSTVRLRRAVWLEGEQPSSQDAANTLHPQIYVTAFSQLHTPPTTPHQKNPQPNWSSF